MTPPADVYDLHCHSTASDGSLPPAEVVLRARRQGVTVLALTDHDTTAGLAEARLAATACGIALVDGIELSTCWHDKCLHIVGLGIDPCFPALAEASRRLQAIRQQRAQAIAAKLEGRRIYGAYEAVLASAGEGMVTRTHFAAFLVAHNHVSSHQEAFDRYLGNGKAAYCPTAWADMAEAVGWVVQAGGVAVLAHPLRYQLTGRWLGRLLGAFKEAGGAAIEVVTGHHNPNEIARLAHLARQFKLAGSVGSDFHRPDNPPPELGRLAPLPTAVQPVWALL